MKKGSACALGIIGLLFGIILGFVLSPVKFGIGNCGNNCGNTNYYPKNNDFDGNSDE